MGKVIILEGPDGGGKTTLAKQLEAHGWEYRHEGPPPIGTDTIAHYLNTLDASLRMDRNIVHDRLFAGETVYGPICRGVDRLGKEGLRLFKRIVSSKSIIQYLCMPSQQVLDTNYSIKISELDDVAKSWNRFWAICDRYWQLDHVMDWKTFDYTKHKVQGVLMDAEINCSNKLPEGTVGSRLAKYLFIGDQPNHDSIDVPFHAISGSSGYLNSAIYLAGLHEDAIALSNAYGPREKTTHSLSDIMDSLPDVEHVFLLGNKAQFWFEDSIPSFKYNRRFKVHLLAHPSYLKRFKGHNPQVLADRIKEVLSGSTN